MDAIVSAHVVLPEATEAEHLSQDVREGLLEIPIGHDVDDRIQRGVEVPDPK